MFNTELTLSTDLQDPDLGSQTNYSVLVRGNRHILQMMKTTLCMPVHTEFPKVFGRGVSPTYLLRTQALDINLALF